MKQSNNTPKLRFAQFDGDWEQYKVGDFLTESRISGTNGLTAKKLTVKLWGKGVVCKEEIYSGSQATKYYIRKSGQFIYGKLDFLNQAFGIIPNSLDGYESTLDAPAFDISKDLNADFFLRYVLRKEFYLYQGMQANGSRKAKRIHSDTFLEMPIMIPSIAEQTTIGNFFRQIDKFIALHQGQLDKVKTLKKGLLQKMFPAQGETVPQIRFPQFTDAWEQCKLGDLLVERNTQIEESEEYPLMSFVQGVGVTPKSERYDRSFLVKDNTKKYKMTCLGDFIYSSNNLETGSIGFNRTGKAVISPVYSIFRSKKELESQFIGILSTRKDFIYNMVRFRQGVVYGQWKIPEKDFLTIQIFMPNDDEQRKIIQLFRQVDELITLHQRKLAHLKTLKKALLQQMFV
ncbi:MAG: restriction endonuclease subunit S [Moraxella sp.]|nr:restriction endonuclease subunit S [Moraxella sp.]